ncbi:MAG: hypothetical protein V2I38_17150, partial [Alcanivoracaceae bacterium]|nr:hypothetical protein [Alcanivoracaceae bacterium]
GPGDDTFAPGAGSDLVFGDVNGFDILDLSAAPNAVIVDLSIDQVIDDGYDPVNPFSDTVYDINRVIGSQYNDTLTGKAEADQSGIERFVGGPGNDTINGGGGNDGVDYRFSSSPFANPQTGNGVNIDLQAGTASDPYGGTDTLSNIYRVFGSENDDIIRGDAGDNALSGESGNDRINGGGGNDFLFGGEGLDTFEFSVGGGSDVIGDFNQAEGDNILLVGLEVTSVTAVDTGNPSDENYDSAVDSTLVTFNDGGDVLLSDILLTQEELFGP